MLLQRPLFPCINHRGKKAKTGAERAKAYRQRRKVSAANGAPASSEHLVSLDLPFADATNAELAIPPPANDKLPKIRQLLTAPHPAVTLRAVTQSRRPVASIVLLVAASALAAAGITINGWFARSLGATETAGWLFLAIGVAADLVALVMPSCATGLWHARRRPAALVGWGAWAVTFAFAITAGIGSASVNIADVTLARASRVTPAAAVAQAALSDAVSARDRECRGGVGKFCREREAAVIERRQALDTATQAVGQTADPQTDAASRIVAWATHGALQPAGNDFAMLRLVLLALLRQIGGVLLMVGRSAT
jgi:hypothetical protein